MNLLKSSFQGILPTRLLKIGLIVPAPVIIFSTATV
jgi:hypothetical protein